MGNLATPKKSGMNQSKIVGTWMRKQKLPSHKPGVIREA